MEAVLAAPALEAGPVYFFDQMKTRKKERGKKIPEELSSYVTIDLLPGFAPSPLEGRNAICAGEHAERREDGFLNNDNTRKEKYPVLRQVSCHSLCKTTIEDSNPKISQTSLIPQADEDSPLNTLNKSVAANMLQELGDKLELLARYKTGFHQELVNVLTCTWRELTEAVDDHKWHQKSLVYKSVRSRRSQASEEVKSGAPGSKCSECELTAIRKEKYKKSFALPACTVKEKRKPETASSMPVGSEAPVVQNDAGQSPATISFSLSSNICEERGWISQLSDSNSEDIDQKLPYVWTPERLEQIRNQINTVTVMFNHEGGLVTNKDEEMVREWKWPQDGKLAQPVVAQVNEYITVRIAGRFAISLVYKWQHESVCLSLSPRQDAALPQLEELPKLTEQLMKNEVREAAVSHTDDIVAARDLRNLQRKIWSIVDDWMRYYHTALGIDRIHLQKTSDLPLKPLRKGITQSAGALPLTLDLQRSQGKRKENSHVPESETPLLLDQVQSAPRSMQQEPCSHPFRAHVLLNSKTKSEKLHMTWFNLNKRRNVLDVINSWDKMWGTSQAACPAVLRRVMMGEEGKTCKCSNHRIPYVSDLEYDHLINNKMSSNEQIIVVCVSSSQTNKDQSEDKIEQLYERKNKNRSMPCAQSCLDSFRLLRYDITSADAFTDHKGSLLEKRHNVVPGMFLMYIQGKLLFANHIFNGYSKSTKDLQKQIAKTRNDYRMGYCLPADFKF
ncbi:C3orf20-like protein, partial [Columba guinea]